MTRKNFLKSLLGLVATPFVIKNTKEEPKKLEYMYPKENYKCHNLLVDLQNM